MASKVFAVVGITSMLLVVCLLSFTSVTTVSGGETLPDYKNIKFIPGFTPSGISTPYKNGSPQTCINCIEVDG